MKTVGRRIADDDGSPGSFRKRALLLQRHADRLNPCPKPRGFVFKGRTWAEYTAWRRAQPNPRLW